MIYTVHAYTRTYTHTCTHKHTYTPLWILLFQCPHDQVCPKLGTSGRHGVTPCSFPVKFVPLKVQKVNCFIRNFHLRVSTDLKLKKSVHLLYYSFCFYHLLIVISRIIFYHGTAGNNKYNQIFSFCPDCHKERRQPIFLCGSPERGKRWIRYVCCSLLLSACIIPIHE